MNRLALPRCLVLLALLCAPVGLALHPVAEPAPLAPYDCNENGVEDAVDIASGASSDLDCDGVPDECQNAR